MKILKNPDKKAIIKVPPSSNVPIETSEHLFTHHNLVIVLGKRKSGKGIQITNYLRMLKAENKADRILIISPTVLSNKALLNSLDVDDDDCFDPDDPNCMDKVLQIIDDERDDYVNELDKIKRFDQFKSLYDGNLPLEEIDPYLFLEFTDEMGALIRPTTKYGHRPCIHLWLDDCQNSIIFRDRKLMNAAIRHRHIGGMPFKKNDKEFCGAIGCSMYFAIQNLKSQSGACPKCIRNNATQLIIVGKVKDEQELQDVYSSVAGEIDKKDFMEGYNYATKEPHNSFVIDLHPKKPHQRFRKNFNEYIIMDK